MNIIQLCSHGEELLGLLEDGQVVYWRESLKAWSPWGDYSETTIPTRNMTGISAKLADKLKDIEVEDLRKEQENHCTRCWGSGVIETGPERNDHYECHQCMGTGQKHAQ